MTHRGSPSRQWSAASLARSRLRLSRMYKPVKPFEEVVEEEEGAFVSVSVFSSLQTCGVVEVLGVQVLLTERANALCVSAVGVAAFSRCRRLPAREAALDRMICAQGHLAVQAAATARSF